MIKLLLLLFTIFSFTIFFVSCEKEQGNATFDDTQHLTLSLENVDAFPYVVMRQSISTDDPGQVLQSFIEETKKQHVVPTGPLFIIFYQLRQKSKSNHLTWEIGVPTAEGTLVQEPLRLRNWKYERVMQAQKVQLRSVGNHFYPWLTGFMAANDLNSQPMIVVRIIDDVYDNSFNVFNKKLKSEVWVPLGFSSNFAE